MDKYIKQLKDVLHSSADEINKLKDRKIRNENIYLPEELKKANSELDQKIKNVFDSANIKVEEIRSNVISKINSRCTLNPSEITDDIKLFNGTFNFRKDELLKYIDKYKSNYTMTNAILKYIDQNKTDDSKDVNYFLIDLRAKIITKEEKVECYNKFCDSVISMLNNVVASVIQKSGNRYRNGNVMFLQQNIDAFGDETQMFSSVLKVLESCRDY